MLWNYLLYLNLFNIVLNSNIIIYNYTQIHNIVYMFVQNKKNMKKTGILFIKLDN